MGGDEAIPGAGDAVQASIILLANEGGAPVMGGSRCKGWCSPS